MSPRARGGKRITAVKRSLILAGLAALALTAALPEPASACSRCGHSRYCDYDRYDRYSRYDNYDRYDRYSRYDRGYYRDRDRFSIGLHYRDGFLGGSLRYDSGRRYYDRGYYRDRYYRDYCY
jgi:hypothetical protein